MRLRDKLAEALLAAGEHEAIGIMHTGECQSCQASVSRVVDAVFGVLRQQGDYAVSLPGHPGEWLTKGGPPLGACRLLVDLDES